MSDRWFRPSEHVLSGIASLDEVNRGPGEVGLVLLAARSVRLLRQPVLRRIGQFRDADDQ